MFEETNSPFFGFHSSIYLRFNKTFGLSSSFVTFRIPMFVLVLFLMTSNKDNIYILNLSSTSDRASWILAICALHIMKTKIGHGRIYVIQVWQSIIMDFIDLFFVHFPNIFFATPPSLLHLSLFLFCFL